MYYVVTLCNFLHVCVTNLATRNATFIFESATWKELRLEIHQLQQVFRQSDPAFLKILNEMRIGQLKPDSIAKLQSLNREIATPNMKPTNLFPLRAQVDQVNQKE